MFLSVYTSWCLFSSLLRQKYNVPHFVWIARDTSFAYSRQAVEQSKSKVSFQSPVPSKNKSLFSYTIGQWNKYPRGASPSGIFVPLTHRWEVTHIKWDNFNRVNVVEVITDTNVLTSICGGECRRERYKKTPSAMERRHSFLVVYLRWIKCWWNIKWIIKRLLI